MKKHLNTTFCEAFGNKYGEDFILHKGTCIECMNSDGLETRGLTENSEAKAIIKQMIQISRIRKRTDIIK